MKSLFEYGILHVATAAVHRTGMEEQEAMYWLEEFNEMGGKPSAFAVIRREVGEWEAVPATPRSREAGGS